MYPFRYNNYLKSYAFCFHIFPFLRKTTIYLSLQIAELFSSIVCKGRKHVTLGHKAANFARG